MKSISKFLAIFFVPIILAFYFLGLSHWDLSVPLVYSMSGGDDIWQLILTKVVVDTGWALVNPFMGAPGIADWHYHSAAQTSALHSVIMLALSAFIDDAVKVQQIYYLLNFGLITVSSYLFCKTFGLHTFVSFCIGLLYSFTTFRINMMFYAYLANYFFIPLALIPVYWTLRGEFANPEKSSSNPAWKKAYFTNKKFLYSALILALMATFDGYYAFFTVLLLGFALAIRAIAGDFKSPLALGRPLLLIMILLGVATALSLPLSTYKKAHSEEFAPGGVEDPILARRPMEAEVYSSSLKLLIAPINNHRIKALRDLGTYLIKTSDDARAFKINQPIVSLGTIPSIFFLVALTTLAIPRQINSAATGTVLKGNKSSLFGISASISFFIFLCCITGGIGSLVAVVFPVIRAYDRFPLFLIFTIYVCAGALLTETLRKSGNARKAIILAVTAIVALLGLFDQIPYSAKKTDEKTRAIFLAERSFVKKIEKSLPVGSMIYQYPYSNYLIESKYYGLGQFSHGRLYLHSKKLRWSNGASKNSPVDKWHMRVSSLPIENLISEISAAGFKGIVFDKSVIPEKEYAGLINYMKSSGITVFDDSDSKLAYASVPDLGYSVQYNDSFDTIDKVIVYNQSVAVKSDVPQLLNATSFRNLLEKSGNEKDNIELTKSAAPDIFVDPVLFKKGSGESKVKNLNDVTGEMACSPAKLPKAELSKNNITVEFSNLGRFPLTFNHGQFPFGFGVHLRNQAGAVTQWDNGYRLTEPGYVPAGATREYKVSFESLRLKNMSRTDEPFLLDVGLVQDGNAWFNNLHCIIEVTP